MITVSEMRVSSSAAQVVIQSGESHWRVARMPDRGNDDITALNHEATSAIIALRKIAGYMDRAKLKISADQFARIKALLAGEEAPPADGPKTRKRYALDVLQSLADLTGQKPALPKGRPQTNPKVRERIKQLRVPLPSGKLRPWSRIAMTVNREFPTKLTWQACRMIASNKKPAQK